VSKSNKIQSSWEIQRKNDTQGCSENENSFNLENNAYNRLPGIYIYFEKNINLGSEFVAGTPYTFNVNDYTINLYIDKV
jgi:hypothetical protein